MRDVDYSKCPECAKPWTKESSLNLNKDVESWARVSVDAVFSGSETQARNVLEMALQDIAKLGATKCPVCAARRKADAYRTAKHRARKSARETCPPII
jgi:hypothetical protein